MNYKFFMRAIIASIVFLTFLGGFYYYYNAEPQKEATTPPPLTQQTWQTYNNEFLSFDHLSDVKIETYEDQTFKQISVKPVNEFGDAGYIYFMVRIYELEKISELTTKDPIDAFLYSFLAITGESIETVKKNIYIKEEPMNKDFDAEVVLSGIWWQGGGTKTASIKIVDDKAIIIWTQAYEGYYDDNNEFILEETEYTQTMYKMLNSFELWE